MLYRPVGHTVLEQHPNVIDSNQSKKQKKHKRKQKRAKRSELGETTTIEEEVDSQS